MRRVVLALAAAAVLVLLALGGNTALRVRGWTPGTDTPAERLALLAPSWQLALPAAAKGAAPVAVLLSGCDGPHDNMALWSDVLTGAGWAALILDSHAPRGLNAYQQWRLVCSGQELTGAERAGDIAVALAALGGMDGVDADRAVLLGASHGGWAVGELLALANAGAPPPGLTAWPEPPTRTLERVRGAVLLYPYCGFASGAAGGWDHPAPVLTVLAARDRIVDTDDCLAEAAALAGRGIPTRTLVVDADHGFDQRERSALSPLTFDEAATARAEEAVEQFVAMLFAERSTP